MRMLLIAILLAFVLVSESAHATEKGAQAAAREWCIQDQNFGTCEGPVGATPTSIIGASLDDVCSKFAAAWAGYPWFNYDGTHSNSPIPTGQCVWNNPFNGEPPPFYWAEDAKQIFKCQLPGYQGWQPGGPEPTSCPDPDPPVPLPNKNVDPCCQELSGGSNPINGGTGNKSEVQTDFQGAGALPLQFIRYYNSDPTMARQGVGSWSHNYQRQVQAATGTTVVLRPHGQQEIFVLNAGRWVPDGDIVALLTRTTDSQGTFTGWKYIGADDAVEIYDTSGVLLSITNRAGVSGVMSYSTPTTPHAVAIGPGLLIGVVDSFGRQLAFTYDSLGRFATATDVDGRVYRYTYDSNNNLTLVTYPDDRTRQYFYHEPAYSPAPGFTGLLTGIVDENGTRFATFSYDAQGRAIASEHSGGASRTTFAYSTSPQQTVITDALGTSRTFSLALILGVVKNTGSTLPCSYCGITSSSVTYDTNGNVTSRTDFNSKKVCYAYDLNRNLETARLDGALASEDCATVLANPPNRPDVRKITTTWNASYRLPATITEPASGGTKTTTFIYDATGNFTQKSTVAPKNDGTSTTITRTWNWTYATLGRVLTATDPDNHTTTTTYYADNDADLGKRGNVQTVTNAAGHITQITAYDANGRPLSVTDANGLITALGYDLRGRLTSRQVGTETTSYAYDGVGQLTRVTQPDSSYLHYTYDAGHRLSQINDGFGNEIVYTLDAMGNRTREDTYDPANQMARTRSHTFDALNRLASDLGAQTQTTSYLYDNNGNLLTTTDPLGHAAGNIFDALNRLTQVLDPNLGTTTYTYDGANNLTQVSDPRGSATNYTYDGLNNLTKLVSPDTGTTNNAYDGVGNLLARTDARGVVATYTYDVLNRVAQVIYSKSGTSSETHVFTYDSGANAKGRLSAVTDPTAITSWTYNSQGRVAGKVQQVGSMVQSAVYGYNAYGQLTGITTPSGQQIGYGYTNNRVSSVTINGQSLLTGANTKPFGPLSAWRWGNGLFTFRDYDTDGRLADWEFRNGTSILRKNQRFDAASRITAIADPNTPAVNQAYQYDVLDRLTVAQSGNPVTHTQQFSYDAVGNRQNATVDGAVANLTYAQAGNQLQQMVGAVSANYFNGASALTFAYNNANRLVQVQSSGVTIASYAVNALGQRVSKIVSGVTTLFVYDEQGHLSGEYDNTGNPIQETVWLEDLPLATLRPTGTGNPTPIAIHYVHADHLGSPRAVTRPSDNAIMWQWDNVDPFGANAANENPAGQGTFKYAMRFPGQYYDAETGTSYNYHRDYDPAIGRYEQSDPIALNGGLNTYGYAGADPEDRVDPYGLAWLCTAPLHVAPRLDFGGHGPAHHEFVCDTPQHCGGQDWSREPWYGNPFFGPGIPSVGDRFNPGRCTKIQPDNQCMNDCLARKIDNPGRPPYSVLPNFSWSIAPNCQEWAEAIVQACRPGCIAKK